jgi:hypothetical protein
MVATIRERAVIFGPGQSLVGIETRAVEANGAGAAARRPAVVLLNAGVVHRVGPHRLTVHLARRFARAGHVAFRFDLAGLGDSRARPGTASYEARAIEDVRTAMDHVQKTTGIDRFILGGLCSGADNSVRAALVDQRVGAVVLLDPYAYRTPGFYLRYYRARVSNLRSWVGVSRRAAVAAVAAARSWLPRPGSQNNAGQEPGSNGVQGPRKPMYSRYHPPRELFAAQLRDLIDRGTAIYIAYSGSLSGAYNYAGQFEDAFRPFGIAQTDVSCTFVPFVNHTYTELAAQRQLGDTLVDWASALPPAAAKTS